MDMVTTQIALFSRYVLAQTLNEDAVELPGGPKPGEYKLSFAGCGVTNGIAGVIFAHGLKDQCLIIRRYLEAFLDAGLTVKLVFVGLSRGGIGGAYLAQELRDFQLAQVELNMLLFDPVPGNFIWISRWLDFPSVSNTNQAMDMTFAQNLGRVLVLYPHEPLPAIAVHAPLIYKFPDNCDLEEDVILGCHQGALFLRPQADTCLSFARIRDYLKQCGATFDDSVYQAQALDVTERKLLDLLDRELRRVYPTNRQTHAWQPDTEIVRYPRGRFLNRSHQALAHRLGMAAPPDADPQTPMFMLDCDLFQATK
mmetsp:Transcript_128262/g.208940  ORF Transcript_128262/g.208940 Transcript_128262/m.208940 type:complete len:310 (+) Transcript_128262:3-932(+)